MHIRQGDVVAALKRRDPLPRIRLRQLINRGGTSRLTYNESTAHDIYWSH